MKPVLKLLASLIKKEKFRFILTTLLIIISVVSSLLIPYFTGFIYDTLIKSPIDYNYIYSIIVIIIALALLTSLTNFIIAFLVNRIVVNFQTKQRAILQRKLLTTEIAKINSIDKGDFISRFYLDIEIVTEGAKQFFNLIFKGILTIILSLIFLFFINFYIALTVTLLTPITYFIINMVGSKTRKNAKIAAELQGKMTGYVSEMFKSFETVKTLHFEEKAFDEYNKLNTELNYYGRWSQFYLSMSGPVMRILNYSIYAIVGVEAAVIFLTNPSAISFGDITKVLSYTRRYSAPFLDITNVFNNLYQASVSLQRIEEVNSLPEQSKRGVETLDEFVSTIEFKNVCFSYNTNPMIENFNLIVQKGQKIAIVGPTGAGKTTILNLLLGFMDVNSGEILIDGKNIQSITPSSYYKHFGIVFQDTYIFADTIKNNIDLKQEYDFSTIKEASKKANLNYFIKQNNLGYETLLQEDGTGLSEGQRQLLAISRVFLNSPSILILDEATSSIDTLTEKIIYEDFDNLLENRTGFIVAHRLSTIINSDLILVVKDGKIVEAGTHNELLANKGLYYKMSEAQK